MNEALEKMMHLYDSLPNKAIDTCLKYQFQFNTLRISLYFDALDKDCVGLFLLLNTTEGKELTYLTPINIGNKYLPELPNEILFKVSVGKKLDTFYTALKKCILESNPLYLHYKQDKEFKKGISNIKKKESLPFLWHLRRDKMTPEMFNTVLKTFRIERSTLEKIQKAGFTFVRTDDIEKRRNLEIILKDANFPL